MDKAIALALLGVADEPMNVQMSDLADSLLRILSGMGTKARQLKM